MDRQRFGLILGGTWGLACCGCRTAPVTGRKQLVIMPEQSEIALGLQAYEQATVDVPPSNNEQATAMVRRVGQRIADQSGRSDYQWEFRLLGSSEQNAFALPGGKVAIYDGILPICQNEAGLAVVMSHEVAHALAHHGGERMSHDQAIGIGRHALDFVLQRQSADRRELMLQAYGAASKYGVQLPYSRHQESEADHIGLMLMSRAGYDPAEAPKFWTRFGGVGGDAEGKPPEFLSTHPSDERRAADLQGLLPEAQQLYLAAPAKFGLGESLT